MSRVRFTIRSLALLFTILVACGDDSGEPSDTAGSGASGGSGGGGTAGSAGAPPSAGASGTPSMGGVALYGNFNVTLVPPFEETMTAAMTAILGKVDDGPTPSPSAWSERSAANGCKLYVPAPVFCTPACGSSAACVSENNCVPYPMATSIGSVTLSGIGSAPIAMDPVAGNYQPKAGTSLPYPPCSEGTPVELAADGGGHGALELSAPCIAPLEFPGPLKYQPGQPLRLTWTAPARSELAKIQVKVDLSHHGGTKGKIECEVADTGSVEIPATLIDALVELGVAGFPTVALTRKSSGAGTGKAAQLFLNIASPQERPIEIPGLRSCSEDTDCEAGQTCQADRSCK